MLTAFALFACFGAIVSGIGAHFWILGTLDRAGVQVKYFATITDNWRAYGAYRRAAQEKQWPRWPFYVAAIGTYAGVAGLFAILLANPDLLETMAHWMH